MPPISKVPRARVREWNGYAMAAPLGRSLDRFLWATMLGGTRRDVIRRWQEVYANMTWRQAYRRGWRVVRVQMHVDPKSLQEG